MAIAFCRVMFSAITLDAADDWLFIGSLLLRNLEVSFGLVEVGAAIMNVFVGTN